MRSDMVFAMQTPQDPPAPADGCRAEPAGAVADTGADAAVDDPVGDADIRVRCPGDAAWWTPALSDAERGSVHGEPAWVLFTRRALAHAPEDGLETTSDVAGGARDLHGVPALGAEGRLVHPLWPFLVAAGERFVATAGSSAGTADSTDSTDSTDAVDSTDAADRRVVWDGAQDWLAGRLVRLAGRTLVDELHTARAAGALRGHDPRERFDDFMRALAARGRLTDLLRRRPVLGRLIAEYCLQAVDAADELARRLRADRGPLAADLLDRDPGTLASVRFGLGDPHAGGRTVCLLDFSAGQRLVYKPRPLGLHARWNAVLAWLAQRCPDLASPAVKVLARDGYGWTGFVEADACARPAQIGRFYERLGAQLALLHALDATDIHAENLIAHGEHPMIVDVETLLHPSWLPRTDGADDPAASALAACALRTAVLPSFIFGEHGALDVSALGARPGAAFPDDLPGWRDPGTDAMRLVRRPVPFSPAANRPRLAADATGAVPAPVDPAEHGPDLIRGFRAAYRAVVAHAADLTGEGGVLSRFGGERIRLVMRPSQTYAMLLAESGDPGALHDWSGREWAFAALFDTTGHEHLRVLAAEELAQLVRGDVPTFTARADGRAVRCAGGREFPDLLHTSGLDCARAKIRGMGPRDLRRQEWVIRAAIATLRPGGGHRAQRAGIAAARPPRDAAAAGPAERQRLLALAAGIGDRLAAEALREDGRANWLGLERIGDRYWSVRALGAGLADGYSGVALFLAELGRATGTARYLELAEQAARPLPTLAALLAAQPGLCASVGPGGFSGLGGVCYAVARLSVLLESHTLASAVPAAVAALGHACDPAPSDEPRGGPDLGVADGLAGGVLAARAVFAECGLPDAARLAARAAERISALPRPHDPGFLWGRDGVARALGEPARTRAGGPPVPADRLSDLGWCRGLAGLAPSPAVRERYLALVADRSPLRDLSLCHGETGVLDPLVDLAAAGDRRAAHALADARTALLDSVARDAIRCGTPDGVPTPGLLSGLAGIGYGLLRLAACDDVPSVLLLQPAPSPRGAERKEDTHAQRA